MTRMLHDTMTHVQGETAAQSHGSASVSDARRVAARTQHVLDELSARVHAVHADGVAGYGDAPAVLDLDSEASGSVQLTGGVDTTSMRVFHPKQSQPVVRESDVIELKASLKTARREFLELCTRLIAHTARALQDAREQLEQYMEARAAAREAAAQITNEHVYPTTQYASLAVAPTGGAVAGFEDLMIDTPVQPERPEAPGCVAVQEPVAPVEKRNVECRGNVWVHACKLVAGELAGGRGRY